MPLTLKLFKSVFPPFTSCWWAARFCGSPSKSIRYNKFALVLTVAVIFMASGKSMGQTWLPATGGNWTIGSNWSGGSAPAPGANVIINSDQSANITNVPAISLASLTVSGTCTLVAATAGNTITVTSAFSVSAGEVFTLGSGTGRFNFTLGASSVSTIAGTMTHPSTAPVRAFTNNGDLTITGLLNGGTTTFTTASGSTLRIGSLAGITNAGATGSVQMTGTRSYNTGANYHYIGSGAQAVGNGLPGIVSSLTINNTGGTVTLASGIAITNGLDVESGTFAIGANNITTVASVSMTGTSITGTSTITLAGNITTVASATSATISALIATGASNRTVTIADGAANPDLIISSVISGTGGVIKAGTGALTLSGANTFGTGLNHTAGTININHATAPGTGTFTIAGGTIDNTSAGAITLSNNNTQAWNGNFVFTGTQSLNLGTGAVTPNASSKIKNPVARRFSSRLTVVEQPYGRA